MKVIIAEKPSVAQSIAAIVGATVKVDGYYQGNNYKVTWAYGHLITLCEPKEPWSLENLPIIPLKWITEPVSMFDKGERKINPRTYRQLKIISALFHEATEIIVATDAGREGELIFRFIYEYLAANEGVDTPYKRLWISSLTDKAIREGLEHLQPGSNYDRLSDAAKGRSQADWLVGMNATRALTLIVQAQKPGCGVFSVGRVQTPTLCMVCKRFIENRDFISTPYYILAMNSCKDHVTFAAKNPRKFKTREEALSLMAKIKSRASLLVSSVVRKNISEAPPLLYDLTTLQKEANSKYDLSADTTLSVAQALYEKKYITYPRTNSRYVPEDVFEELPSLISILSHHSPYGDYALTLIDKPLFRRSVDGSKVTDHHALLPTENIPGNTLSEHEQTIYNLIVARLFESISTPCLKDVTNLTLISPEYPNFPFFAKGYTITAPGWYGVRRLKDVPEEDQDEEVKTDLPVLVQNEYLPLFGLNLLDKKSKAPALLTEATLLAMMESCGKEIETEEEREAIKTLGIGTPATRAAIIENLLKKDLMIREKKSLLPTKKGLVLYEAVKNLSVANVSLTGKWEYTLQQVELGQFDIASFNKEITKLTYQIVKEITGTTIQSEKLHVSGETNCPCPKCKTHKISIYANRVVCNNKECDFFLYPTIAGRKLTTTEIITLCLKGKTKLLKGFTSKNGKPFDRTLILDANYKVAFVIDKPRPTSINCPKCGTPLAINEGKVFCKSKDCGYQLFRNVCGHRLTEDEITQLFLSKRTDLISDFIGKFQKTFKAYLGLTDDFKTQFIYFKN